MIVCHCQSISDHEIRAAVDWMRAADPLTVITPGKVYRALGKRADCGGCMPLFLDTLRRSPSFQIPETPVLTPARSARRHDPAPHPAAISRHRHERPAP